MLRVFNSIRSGAVGEGRLGKYLGYAVGEIILIVVGILIALQINSWAEDRKDRAFERESLQQILRNLQRDSEELSSVLGNRLDAVRSIDNILAIADANAPPEELQYWLGDVIHFDRFHALTNAYDVLKSRGLDIVRDDQLRLQLGIYYDGWAKEIREHNADLERAFFDIWIPMLHNEFETFEWGDKARPQDPAAFLADRVVLNVLQLERDNHFGAADKLESMMRVNTDLQTLIELELQD